MSVLNEHFLRHERTLHTHTDVRALANAAVVGVDGQIVRAACSVVDGDGDDDDFEPNGI